MIILYLIIYRELVILKLIKMLGFNKKIRGLGSKHIQIVW